jgi:multiple sugar transport system substrate-binding protein
MKMRRRDFMATTAAAGLVVGGVWRPASAAAGSAAQTAVEAAKKLGGGEVTIVWEAGLQALDPLNFSGPMWEKETGFKVKVIEVPVAEMFTKILQEHRAATGAYDALNVIPSWMPDLARAGALEPLDAYVDKYGYREELQEIAPVYRDNQMKVGDQIFGFPDDGDVFVLYYRKDVLGDPKIRDGFKAKHGYDLPMPPKTWNEFDEVSAHITEATGGKPYGAGSFREMAYGQFLFQERFRNEGGRFFDPETMKATINNDIGVKVFTDWLAENKSMPPGVETWGFVENLAAFLQGDTAMTISWPPYGRWAAGYGTEQEALSWVPKSKVAGKVGYAMTPGGHPQLAAGFALSVAAGSRQKEAAYLFIQWLNSKDISLQRVQLPYALRDPFRENHFTSEEYKARWPDAPEYLKALQEGAVNGLLDLSLIQTDKYEEAIRQGVSRLWAGEDPKGILDDIAAQWDQLTERVGLEKQKGAYQDWASKPNAYPS